MHSGDPAGGLPRFLPGVGAERTVGFAGPRGGQQEGQRTSHTPGDPKGSADMGGGGIRCAILDHSKDIGKYLRL